MANFQYVTTNVYQSGSFSNDIIAELPFTGVNFTQQLNSVGTFSGHVLLSGIHNLNVFDGTIPGKTILWVLYTNKANVTKAVWSGVIWHREWDSETQTLSIQAQEMMSLYQRRRIATTKTYTSQDPINIAYNLLQYTEGVSHGNTGLQYNSATSGLSTSKTYNGYELKPVYSAIKDLASNYFDFAIKPSISGNYLINTFTAGSPLGTIYSSTNINAPVFQFPGNLIKYNFPEDATAAANTLYGLGTGANNTKLVATYVDSSKISGSGDWPLLQDSTSYTDVGDLQLLKDLTLGQGNAVSYPPTTVQVVIPTYVDPYYGSYSVGDEVRLNVHDDFTPNGLDLIMRIVAIDVSPGEQSPDRVTVTLTRQLASGSVS